jgi:ABC-type lipoprotein release transport system permease subunit
MRALLLALAWRSLWRNTRRTLITLVIVAVGMWSILAFTMMLKAWALSTREAALRGLTGEAQIHAKGYLDDPGIDHRMAEPRGPLLRALDSGPITGWTPRLRVPAVIQSEYRSLGVTFLGVEPQGERQVSDLPGEIATGRYLRDANDAAIVLGSHMIARLKTRVGKRVIVMSEAEDGHLAEQSFTIVGAFGGTEGPQDQYAFTGLRAAQAMLGAAHDISEISFDVTDDKALPIAIGELRDIAPALDIEPWTQFAPIAYAMDQVSGTYVAIWLAIMFVLMAIGIVNAQLMAVFERTREFGLLQALGMRPRLILLQVALESALLIGIGVLLGDAIAALSIAPFGHGVDLGSLAAGSERFGGGNVLYPRLELADVVTFSAIIWLLGIATALWPASRAAHANPIEAMSHV